jgi:S1-C subfamily serine protease
MRENDSDSGDGWQQPSGYVSPWESRDEGEAARTSEPAPSAAPPLDNGTQDIISFGNQSDPDGGYGQPGYGQPTYGTPPPSYASGSGSGDQPNPQSQPWYASQPGAGEPGSVGEPLGSGPASYGSEGYEPGGYGAGAGGSGTEPGGYGAAAGGYGTEPGGYGAAAGGYGSEPGGYGASAGGSGAGTGGSDGFGSFGSGTAGGWGAPGSPPRPPRRRGRHAGVYVAVALLAASVGAGLTVALDNNPTPEAAPGISSNDVPAPHSNAAGSGASAAAVNWTALQRKVRPALVDITSTLKYNSETAEGTGMILSSTGLVLTNNHVIDQATNVSASLVTNAGRKYRARVIGYDNTDDVALLQLVGASGLPVVSFGNSAQVSLGTQVLALGNAEGKGGATPARGIINALDRSIQASDQGSNSTEDLNHMLQTNAQIQQGDSGGALINGAGQVIGMITAANTSASGQSGSSGGTLGFAIPINTASAIAKEIAGGKASATVYIGLPGFLGVEVAQSASSNPQQQAADEEQTGGGGPSGGAQAACQASNSQASAPAKIAPVNSGALILGVLCGTAANTRGLTAGDVITAVDGQAVTTPSSLTGITAKYHAGAVVSVTWVGVRGNKHTASLKLGAGPAR